MARNFHIPAESLLRAAQFVFLGIVSLGVSIYVFANGFELATNINIPYALAIEPVSIQQLIALNQTPAVSHDANVAIGNFGEPKYLKVASQTTKLALIPGVLEKGEYLARASTGHYIYVGPAKSGNLGTTLVYIRQSWRTISHPEDIVVGSNLFIDTDKDWRYMFRVSDTVRTDTTSQYLLPDSQKSQIMLVLLSQDGSERIIVADFVNLQNIQQ